VLGQGPWRRQRQDKNAKTKRSFAGRVRSQAASLGTSGKDYLLDAGMRAGLGQRARTRAETRFSLDTQTDDFAGVLLRFAR